MSDAPAIEVRDLRKIFPIGFSGLRKVEALRGMNLEVRPGEIYGFLGPNGAGKSTTIKCVTGLVFPTSGEVRIFGVDARSVQSRRRLGYLPELPQLYDFLSGAELLRYFATLAGVPRAKIESTVGELLERVGLGHAGDLRVRRYSKGMGQRLGIAQALLGDPDLLIFDEPMSGLDPIGRKDVRELMLDLKHEGKTVFFSTHIIPDVEMICDRVGVVTKGQLIREGTLAEILEGDTADTEVVLMGMSPEGLTFPEGVDHRQVGERLVLAVPPDVPIDPILQQCLGAGLHIERVHPQSHGLEDLLVRGFDGEEAATP